MRLGDSHDRHDRPNEHSDWRLPSLKGHPSYPVMPHSASPNMNHVHMSQHPHPQPQPNLPQQQQQNLAPQHSHPAHQHHQAPHPAPHQTHQSHAAMSQPPQPSRMPQGPPPGPPQGPQTPSPAVSSFYQAYTGGPPHSGGLYEMHKRPYRKRRKDPSCDACRERKVKCDSVDFSSCSECVTRQIKCQFSKSSIKRISSIKQIKGLEGSMRQMRDQLLEFRALADHLKIDLPSNLRQVGALDLPMLFEDDGDDSPRSPPSGSENTKETDSPRVSSPSHTPPCNFDFRVNPSDNMTYANTATTRGEIKMPSYNPTTTHTKTNAEAISPVGLPEVQNTLEKYGFDKPIYYPWKWRSRKTVGDLIAEDNMPALPKWEIAQLWMQVFHEMYQHWVPVVVWPDFVERVCILYGRIHKPAEEREAAKNALPVSWLGIFFSVLCLGARDNMVKGYSIRKSGFEYLENAQKCMNSTYDDGSVECIQICVMLSFFHHERGHVSVSRVWIRHAAELCEEFGLLRLSESDAEVDPVIRHAKSLMIWTLYAVDRLHSLYTGRSLAVTDLESSSLHHPSPFLLRGDYSTLRRLEKQGPMTTEQQITHLVNDLPIIKSDSSSDESLVEADDIPTTLDTRDSTAHSKGQNNSTAIYWLESTQMFNASAHMFRFSSVVGAAIQASNVLAAASLDLLEKQSSAIDRMWPQKGQMDETGPLNHVYVPPVFYLEYLKMFFRRHNLTPNAPAHLRQRAVTDCQSTSQQIYRYLRRIIAHLTPAELAAPAVFADDASGVPMGTRNWREKAMVVNFGHLHVVIAYAVAYLASSGHHLRAIIMLEFVKNLCNYQSDRAVCGMRLLGFVRHWNRRLAAVGEKAIFQDEEALALLSLDMQSGHKSAWVWDMKEERKNFMESQLEISDMKPLKRHKGFVSAKDKVAVGNKPAATVAEELITPPDSNSSPASPAATKHSLESPWDEWDLLRQEILALGKLAKSQDTDEDQDLLLKMVPEMASRLKKRPWNGTSEPNKKPKAEDRRMSISSII
ncbi:hypothetical protein CJU90_6095 [Yarrowia sp. C11]|nr:hypothetical protein CJU90_6095 [Yarrowia sp. C11]KAG5370808.1 hypothetical protein CKK34_0935 [Yarrowia sp. E02]